MNGISGSCYIGQLDFYIFKIETFSMQNRSSHKPKISKNLPYILKINTPLHNSFKNSMSPHINDKNMASQLCTPAVSHSYRKEGCSIKDFQAIKIIKKYRKYTSEGQTKKVEQKKMRNIYDSFIKLLHDIFVQNFQLEIAKQLGIILNKLVFLYETDIGEVCSWKQPEIENTTNTRKVQHSHQEPEYKIFAYECLQKQYEQIYRLKGSLQQEIREINQKMAEMNNEINHKNTQISMKQVYAVNLEKAQALHLKQQKYKSRGQSEEKTSEYMTIKINQGTKRLNQHIYADN